MNPCPTHGIEHIIVTTTGLVVCTADNGDGECCHHLCGMDWEFAASDSAGRLTYTQVDRAEEIKRRLRSKLPGQT